MTTIIVWQLSHSGPLTSMIKQTGPPGMVKLSCSSGNFPNKGGRATRGFWEEYRNGIGNIGTLYPMNQDTILFYLSSPAKCNLLKLFSGRITINIFHVLEFRSPQTSEKPINKHGFHSCSCWVKLGAAEQCWIFRFLLLWTLLSHLALSFSGDKKKGPRNGPTVVDG